MDTSLIAVLGASILIVFGVAALLGLGVFLYVMVRPGEELGRVAVVSKEPFRLVVQTQAHEKVSLWADVDVHFDTLELSGPIAITKGGEEMRAEVFELRRGGHTLQGSGTRVKRVWIAGTQRVRGTTRVLRVDVPRESEIVVTGTITAGPSTEIDKLELVLTGG